MIAHSIKRQMRESLVIIEPAPIHSMDGDQRLIPSPSQNAKILSSLLNSHLVGVEVGELLLADQLLSPPLATLHQHQHQHHGAHQQQHSGVGGLQADHLELVRFRLKPLSHLSNVSKVHLVTKASSFLVSVQNPFFGAEIHGMSSKFSPHDDLIQSSSSSSISQLETFTDGFSNASRFSWFMNCSSVSFFV